MNFVLPDKIYTILKWILCIVSPALVVLIRALSALWGWNIPVEAICGTIEAVTLFLATIFCIGAYNYKKNNKTE